MANKFKIGDKVKTIKHQKVYMVRSLGFSNNRQDIYDGCWLENIENHHTVFKKFSEIKKVVK